MVDLATQKQIQEHFDHMYQAGQKPWSQHPIEPLLDNFFQLLWDDYPKTNILDIGCGDGSISILAAKEGHEVWGIDSSITAIREAEAAAQAANVIKTTHFQLGDALDLPYDGDFFDAMIDDGLFHHILPENRSIYFQNILRVLKPKSYIYLSVFSKHNPEGIGQRFTREEIRTLFSSFQILQFEEDPFPPKAPAHIFHFILKRK